MSGGIEKAVVDAGASKLRAGRKLIEKGWSVAPLTGKENYNVWAFTIKNHLKTMGLIKYVTPTAKMTEMDPEEEQATMSMLISAMTPGEIEKIMHCDTAEEIWDHLKSAYGSKTSNIKLELMAELSKLRAKNAREVADTINKALVIKGKLKNHGVEIDDTMVINAITTALPGKFEGFLDNWTMLDVDYQTLTRFTNKLLEKAKGLSEKEEGETALRTHQTESRDKHGARQETRHCYNCGQLGHISRNCSIARRQAREQPWGRRQWPSQEHQQISANSQPAQQPWHAASRGQSPSSGFAPKQDRPWQQNQQIAPAADHVCNYCHKIGHWKQECRKLQRAKQATVESEAASNAAEIVCVASGPGEDPDSESAWLVDSGATSHMTANSALFSEYRRFLSPIKVEIGDDSVLEAIGSGLIRTTDGEFEALFVPGLGKRNLFSVPKALDTQKGSAFVFHKDVCEWKKDGALIRSAPRCGKSYFIELHCEEAKESVRSATTLEVWHKRLAHLEKGLIKKMMEHGAVEGLRLINEERESCEDCLTNKCRRSAHRARTTPKAVKPAQALHFDVIGPIKPIGLELQKYILVGIDEATRFRFVACLREKGQVSPTVIAMINRAMGDTGNHTLRITTDNGSEFLSDQVKFFLAQRGIERSFSVNYTPEQNGLVERDNQTLINQARTLLNSSNLQGQFWPEAVQTATYASNRSISHGCDTTPYEQFLGRKPNIGNLRVFGQLAVVLQPAHQRAKFDEKGKTMLFVGYTDRHNTFRFFDEDGKRIVISCDAAFLSPTQMRAPSDRQNSTPSTQQAQVEQESNWIQLLDFSHNVGDQTDTSSDEREPETTDSRPEQNNPLQESNRQSPSNTTSEGEDSSDNEETNGTTKDRRSSEKNTWARIFQASAKDQELSDQTEEPESQKSERPIEEQPASPTPSTRSGRQGGSRLNYRDLSRGVWNLFESANLAVTPPKRIEEAGAIWRAAADEEMKSMIQNQVFQLVSRPQGNVVGCRWIFTVKTGPDGSVKPKARLVAQGFSQREGVDFKSTFAPVAHADTIRMLFAIAAAHQLCITQCDVKTAFLHGEIDCDIYMEQPKGYDNGDRNQVWLLKRSIYGLKQSPKCWYRRISQFFRNIGLTQSTSDSCLFFAKDILIGAYVDDFLLITKDHGTAKRIVDRIGAEFETKIINTKKFLGISYEKTQNGNIVIHQTEYVKDIIAKYGLADAHPAATPMEPGQLVAGDGGVTVDQGTFREIVGCLMFVATQTRPDIAYAVGFLGRKVLKPTSMDWAILKRCLRYLKGTSSLGITYQTTNMEPNDPTLIEAYSDASYGGDASAKSTSGLIIFYLGSPIAWSSKLQKGATTSSTEAEFVAVSATIKRLTGIRQALIDIGIPIGPTPVYCDNKGARLIIQDEMSAQRTRHLGAQLAYAREKHQHRICQIKEVAGKDQKADIMTKPLTTAKFLSNRHQLMMMMLTALMVVGTVGQFPYKDLPLVLFLRTKHYVETGRELAIIRVTNRDQCRRIRQGLESTDPTKATHQILQKALDLCETTRKDKFIPALNNLEYLAAHYVRPTTRLARDVGDRLNETTETGLEIEYTEDRVWDYSGFGYGAAHLLGVIDLPGILDNSNTKSSINRVPLMDEKLREVIKSINIKTEQISSLRKAGQKVNDATKAALQLSKSDHARLSDLLAAAHEISDLISAANIEISEDAARFMEISASLVVGRMNTWALYRLFPEHTDLRDILAEETSVQSIVIDRAGITFRFYKPQPDKEVTIYRAEPFKMFNTRWYYRLYIGPRYIIRDARHNCSAFIDDPHQLAVRESCTEQNQTINFMNEEYWTSKSFGVGQNGEHTEEWKPKIIEVDNLDIIQCYGNSIEYANRTISCPPNPIGIPSNEEYVTKGHRHRHHSTETYETKTSDTKSFRLTSYNETGSYSQSYEAALDKIYEAEHQLGWVDKLQLHLKYADQLHPNIVAALPYSTVIMAAIFCSLIYYMCQKDPLVRLAETQLLTSMADRAKSVSAPNLLAPATAPNINITINSTNGRQDPLPLYPQLDSESHCGQRFEQNRRQIQFFEEDNEKQQRLTRAPTPYITEYDDHDRASRTSSLAHIPAKPILKSTKAALRRSTTSLSKGALSLGRTSVSAIKRSASSISNLARPILTETSTKLIEGTKVLARRSNSSLSTAAKIIESCTIPQIQDGLRDRFPQFSRWFAPRSVSTISLPTTLLVKRV